MKQIRQLHLYLGTLFAPIIIFFAFSGALQTFNFHESTKDGSYKAPAWIVALANIHKDQRLARGPGGGSSLLLKWFVVLMAVGLIATTILGIYMAFKFNRDKRVVAGLIVAGILIPVVALLLH
jgi:hypothetical protein